MSLSGKIEQERQAILARRAEGERLAAERRTALENRTARLNAALAPLITQVPSHLLKARNTKDTESVHLELAGEVPDRGRRFRRAIRPPVITLSGAAHYEGEGWRLSVKDEYLPFGLFERRAPASEAETSPHPHHGFVFTDLGAAVAWFEDHLARAVAAIEVWQADHPVTLVEQAAVPVVTPAPASAARNETFTDRLRELSKQGVPLSHPSFPDRLRQLSLSDWALIIFLLGFFAMVLAGGVEP